MPRNIKKVFSKKPADKYGEPPPSIVDALIEGERSGVSNKNVKDIIAFTKKKLKNG